MEQRDPDDQLSSALRDLADTEEGLGTSSAVGMRLLAEVDAIARERRRRQAALALAAAAAIVIVAGTAWRTLPSDLAATPPSQTVPVVSRELVTEFFPLAYSNVPARGGYVLRMQVPRDTLLAFGTAPADRADSSQTVLADVVIGDDGLARAVRFVQIIRDDGKEQAP